jgi:hypothetical protein
MVFSGAAPTSPCDNDRRRTVPAAGEARTTGRRTTQRPCRGGRRSNVSRLLAAFVEPDAIQAPSIDHTQGARTDCDVDAKLRRECVKAASIGHGERDLAIPTTVCTLTPREVIGAGERPMPAVHRAHGPPAAGLPRDRLALSLLDGCIIAPARRPLGTYRDAFAGQEIHRRAN